MKRAVTAGTVRAISGAFALCFIWLIEHITVNGGYYGYKEVRLLLCTALALGAMAGLWRLAGRYEAALARRSGAVTALFLAGMGLLQMTMGLRLRYKPLFDIDAVYGAAVQWAETGSFASYYEYYGYFFNNFGALRFMYGVFRLAGALGVRDWYLAATGANCALSLLTMFATGQAARKLLGVRGQMAAYGLFAMSPPFYFIAPAFYTDALSMPFPVLIYWLCLLARERPRRRSRLVLYALAAVAASVGAQIKATVVIALIAVVIDGALTWSWRRTAALGAIAAAVLLLGQAGLERDIYRHLDRAQAEEMRTPLLHWVMMGLSGSGMYDPADYDLTRSFQDPEERDAALRAEIGDRLRALGPGGLVRLLTVKGDICFGDGTYGLSDCLGGEPRGGTGLRELLLSGGRYNELYRHVCTGVLLALYVLMSAAGLRDALLPRGEMLRALVPRLALLGLLAFLLCWEARWRYFSNFVPMIFLAALQGMGTFLKNARQNGYNEA